MHQHHLVLPGEGDQPLHEGEVDARRGRVVGERENDHPGLGPGLLPGVHQAVEEIVAGVGGAGPVDVDRGSPERNLAHVGAGEQWAPDVDGVGGRGHQCGVTGLDEDPHEVGEPLLGPDGGDHLGFRVELDPELAQVEVRDGAPQLGNSP
jgi:hypothetical protein